MYITDYAVHIVHRSIDRPSHRVGILLIKQNTLSIDQLKDLDIEYVYYRLSSIYFP